MAKPETIFKVGAVRAAVFRNAIQKSGQQVWLPKVVLEVRYRDPQGQWKGTNSLSINDLPKAILALQKAYDYLTSNPEPPPTEPRATSANKPRGTQAPEDI